MWCPSRQLAHGSVETAPFASSARPTSGLGRVDLPCRRASNIAKLSTGLHDAAMRSAGRGSANSSARGDRRLGSIRNERVDPGPLHDPFQGVDVSAGRNERDGTRVNHVVAAKSTGIGPVNLRSIPSLRRRKALTSRPAARAGQQSKIASDRRRLEEIVFRLPTHIINLSRHSGRTIHLSSARGHPVPVVVQGGRATLKVMEAVIVDAERNS